MRKIGSELNEKLTQLLDSMGFELLGCEQVSGGRPVLRLYMDSAKGVTADDCSRVSRQISAMLDVEQPTMSDYVLEVSSPGIDRPLFLLKHYQKVIGCEVKIRLSLPMEQRRQFRGTLLRIDGDNLHLKIDGLANDVVLPFSAIEKGNLVKCV